MIRPLLSESVEDCRAFHLSCIRTSSECIKVLRTITGKNAKLAKEIIRKEQQYIKQTYADIKEMQRWWVREGKKKYVERQQLLEEKIST